MTGLNGFWFIILAICVAEFAIQMQLSMLSQWVKGVLGLRQPYDSKLEVLCSVRFWIKFIGNWSIVLSPFILLVLAVFNFHKFVSFLVDCSYCTSFWLMTAVNFFYLKQDISTSLLLAPLALVMVVVLDKLHS